MMPNPSSARMKIISTFTAAALLGSTVSAIKCHDGLNGNTTVFDTSINELYKAFDTCIYGEFTCEKGVAWCSVEQVASNATYTRALAGTSLTCGDVKFLGGRNVVCCNTDLCNVAPSSLNAKSAASPLIPSFTLMSLISLMFL